MKLIGHEAGDSLNGETKAVLGLVLFISLLICYIYIKYNSKE
jgi:hypothetical protein